MKKLRNRVRERREERGKKIREEVRDRKQTIKIPIFKKDKKGEVIEVGRIEKVIYNIFFVLSLYSVFVPVCVCLNVVCVRRAHFIFCFWVGAGGIEISAGC